VSWINDLDKSVIALEKLKEKLPEVMRGRIESIEKSDNNLFQIFDRVCGIDLLRINDMQVQGIACRIQYKRAMNTFTIRYKRDSGTETETEYAKRMFAIENDGIYPFFTLLPSIQLYIDNGI
jgi:hypothetical protein